MKHKLKKSEVNQAKAKDIQAKIKPVDVLVHAINRLTYDDSLGIVSERILKRIQASEGLDRWEFKNSDNMEVYLRRCQSNAYFDIRQEEQRQEEVKTALASDLPSEITISESHLAEFRQHLKSKADRRLFRLYFEQGLTLRELAPKFKTSYPTIQRRLLAMSKSLAEIEFDQSLRQPQSLWAAMINGQIYQRNRTSEIPLTNLSPLRRYRRSGDPEELATFKADSERVRQWHGKRTSEGLSSYIGIYGRTEKRNGFCLWKNVFPVKPVVKGEFKADTIDNRPKLEKQAPVKDNSHIGYHKGWGTAYLRHYGLRPWEVSPESKA